MSIAGRNAIRGATFNVFRPTEGDDTVTWSSVHTAIKLEVLPVTDELAREVFGSDAKVEWMAMTTLDIRKRDGLVGTAGTYSAQRFRVSAALPFAEFTQLGMVGTTEPIS